MDKSKSTARERVRIIGAIAGKDIADAVKNRTILSVVLGMALLMLSTQAFPALLKLSATPRAVVYDAGSRADEPSPLLDAMAADGTYRLTQVDSPQALEEVLVELNAEVLGLAIPAGTEARLDAGAPVVLDGYVAWSQRGAAGELAAEMAAYLATLLGVPVQVETAGHLVYPPLKGTSRLGMTAAVLVLLLITTGSFLVPYLLYEEKQTHTMDALRVSPARAADIVLGKALAGLVYCLAAMAVVLAFNRSTVAGWGVALLAVLAGALLAVGVGLLMGTLFETAQQVGAWMLVPIVVLLAPVLLASLGRLPPALAAALPWLPTTALGDMFLLSFSGQAVVGQALPDLALVLAWTLPVYAAVVWRVRRSDR